MSNEDPLSTTAVAQRAASARVDAAEDSATPPMPPPAKTKRKGRPPKAKGSEALEWSEPMTASLMRLRYETYSSKFLSARNNATMQQQGNVTVASAISSQQSAINSSPPQRLKSVMEARFATVIDQLQTQNNNLAALVEFLRKQ
ncbi:hypothetical protein PC129_g10385 [Phytophthora cactorum]|uniref:Uncharacterized protein n=1 Tax=Phytophthora cactorum TaxID=29920 RepID=A0A8T1I1P2_9STRA|nr:hypothetical protein PC114_g13677 [Phytophthora cactorum]KAG2977697.1 hypothetical protein PC118_g12719 [Phytophthora cactorum]KAG3013298.1 hypothetical protein PC119_g12561 [Phytophthora cactorum]KAG3078856.1 hypothetical protein PC122_g12486 [Phytophthora cactorum]KAG3218810.1 hypothetical protein PC129_g10385 [Phytophthora cactorum]